MISFAQNFEDVMLWRALGRVEKGFYIDIGAQDPVIDSVSLWFYHNGWRGVHVEPVPSYAQKLREARPDETVLPVAIGDGSALMTFHEFPGTGISTGDAGIAHRHEESGFPNHPTDVPCVRLSALLDRFADRDIHWLKIDVEGMESSVVNSWAPSPVRPWVVVVESTVPMSSEQSHVAWEASVLGLGYRFCYFDGLNRFYVSNQHPELLTAFDSPPNVFDGFVMAGSGSHSFCARLNESVAQTRQDLEAAEAREAELEQQLRTARQDGAAPARVAELERRVAEQAAEAERRIRDALDQSRQVGQAFAHLELAKEETLQALRALVSKEDALAAQVASAHEESTLLRQDLTEREKRLGELRLSLQTAQAEVTQLHADLALQRGENSANWAREENAFSAAMATAEEKHQSELLRLEEGFRQQLADRERAATAELTAAHAEQAQLHSTFSAAMASAKDEHQSALLRLDEGFRQQLADRERAVVAELAAAHAEQRHGDSVRLHDKLQANLAALRKGFEAELAATRAEQALRQQETAARVADQEQGFNLLLTSAQEEAARLTLHVAELQQAARADLSAARAEWVDSEQRLQREAASRLAEQEQAFRLLVGSAEAEAAWLRSRLEERESVFKTQLQTALNERRESELLQRDRLADQQRDFRSQLLAAHAQANELQIQLAKQLQAVGDQLKLLNRSPFARLFAAFRWPHKPVQRDDATVAAESDNPIAALVAPPVNIALVPSDFAPPAEAISASPPFEVHLEAALLDNLLVLNDVHFVRAAYRALLKREADPSGEENYVALLRTGVDKLILLRDLSRSEEAQRAGGMLPGLSQALRRRRIGQIPIFGPLVLGISTLFRRTSDYDPVSAYRSQSLGMQRTSMKLASRIHAAVDHIVEQQSQMAHVIRRLADRQDEFGSILTSMQSQMTQMAQVTYLGAATAGASVGVTEAAAQPILSITAEPDNVQTQLMRKAAAWRT